MVSQTADYYAFRMSHTSFISGSTVKQNFGFANKEKQDDLGLNGIYIDARFYNPTIGRWDNPDNFSELAYNLSPYRYAFNNPVNVYDPDGNFEYTDGYGGYDSRDASVSNEYSRGYRNFEGESASAIGGGSGDGDKKKKATAVFNEKTKKFEPTITEPTNDGIEPDYTIESIVIPLFKPAQWLWRYGKYNY